MIGGLDQDAAGTRAECPVHLHRGTGAVRDHGERNADPLAVAEQRAAVECVADADEGRHIGDRLRLLANHAERAKAALRLDAQHPVRANPVLALHRDDAAGDIVRPHVKRKILHVGKADAVRPRAATRCPKASLPPPRGGNR